jgi:hypothetical protein
VAGAGIAAPPRHLPVDPDLRIIVDQDIERGHRRLAQIEIADPRRHDEQPTEPHKNVVAAAAAHTQGFAFDPLPLGIIKVGRHGARLDLISHPAGLDEDERPWPPTAWLTAKLAWCEGGQQVKTLGCNLGNHHRHPGDVSSGLGEAS